MLLCCVFAIFIFISSTFTTAIEEPLFANICLGTMLICSGICLYVKFPLFINVSQEETLNKDFYDEIYEQNLGWFKCLFFVLFTAEKSNFVSFFSGATIKLHIKGRICKFTWDNRPAKLVHRLLDFTLLLVFLPIAYLVATGLLSSTWKFGLFIFIAYTLLSFRKIILFYFLSINVSTVDQYKINVVYPYSTIRNHLYKLYGMAGCLTRTIFIMDDTFRLNQTIKDYVIAHEMGHMKNRKVIFINHTFFIFLLAYLTIGPDVFSGIIKSQFAFLIPIITFLIFAIPLRRYSYEKTELNADKYALQTIGKEKCLEALNAMKKDNVKQSNKSWLSRSIPLERRIQFIKDYEDKKD